MSRIISRIGRADEPLISDGVVEFLSAIEPIARDLTFTIFAFEGVLSEATSIPYAELKRKSERPAGVSLKWEELKELAVHTRDIVDLLLVGHPRFSSLERGSFEAFAHGGNLVVEVFDSSSLRVFIADDDIAQGVMDACRVKG